MIQIKTHLPAASARAGTALNDVGPAAAWVRRWVRRVGSVLAITTASLSLAQSGPQQLPETRLSVGMHLVTAEVAASPQERQIGLMHRSSMPTNHGMLFVFERPDMHCFWMKNTLLPLSIAFLAEDGSVVNIADMQPRSEASHCPARPVRFALEMNQGWFDKRGVRPGSRIQGAPFVASPSSNR